MHGSELIETGQVTAAGLLGNVTDSKASKIPLRPDEVLFKKARAPIRYEETDYYFAHANLPADKPLPTSDLLSAIHAYISTLYSRNREPGIDRVWRCMDETALIAFGILLEETAREKLGETGDLAFTEAADKEEERALDGRDRGDEEEKKKARSVSRAERDQQADRRRSWSPSDASTHDTDSE